jgi:hypothetical protein
MVWVMEKCMAGQLDCSHAIAIVQDMASEGQYMCTTETKFLWLIPFIFTWKSKQTWETDYMLYLSSIHWVILSNRM